MALFKYDVVASLVMSCYNANVVELKEQLTSSYRIHPFINHRDETTAEFSAILQFLVSGSVF